MSPTVAAIIAIVEAEPGIDGGAITIPTLYWMAGK